jgi:DNA-binding NarL/FixJ family response regulator/tetratricopeptide (TPR) repeat protein
MGEESGAVRVDRPRITRREAEVLTLVCEHLTNAEIGVRLHVSERTVESHVTSLLRNFGVADRRELIRHAQPANVLIDSLPASLELLADRSTYVGRAPELRVLREAWLRAAAGHTVAVVVSGEAGSGKSRLVAEFARELHDAGGRVMLGASFEDEQDAYQPFVELLTADATRLVDSEVVRRAGDGATALAVLSADLRRRLGLSRQPVGRVADRVPVIDAICGWLAASTAAGSPLLLVLEDLHWMSSTGREVVRSLLRRRPQARTLVVCTTRDTSPDIDADLSRLLGDLERLPTVQTMRLGGLDTHEIAQLAGVRATEAEQIHANTDGNPLLVLHAAAIDRHGESLSSLLGRRGALLDPSTRDTLDLAATIGAEFDAALLVTDDGDGLPSVLESLEAAERAGWILALPGRTGRFAFVHPLFRTHRYESLPLRRRLELHLQAAIALAQRDDERSQSEQARHACLAVPLGDVRTAIELACRAGDAAERCCAYQEAAAHYRRAHDALGALDPPDAATSLDVTVRLGAVMHHAGDGRGLDMLLDAADRARRIGDQAALVRAATAIPHFGAILNPLGDDPRPMEITEAALAVLDDVPSRERAVLTADLACHLLYTGLVAQAIEASSEALAVARSLDDPDLVATVAMACRHVAYFPARLDDYELLTYELRDLGHRLGRVPFEVSGLFGIAILHRCRGELDRWRRALERCREALAHHPLAFFQLSLLGEAINDLLLQGRLADAELLVAQLAPAETAIGHPLVWTALYVAPLRRLQGRDDEIRRPLERAVRVRRGQPAVRRAMLGAVYARIGEHGQARRILEEVRDVHVPEMLGWDVFHSELAEIADIERDTGSAQRVIDAVDAYRGQLSSFGPVVGRPYDQMLAQASLAVDPSAAEQHAVRAVNHSRQRNTPVHLARELTFLAEARRRCGASLKEVRPLVAEAQALAQVTCAAVVDADIERFGLAGTRQ